MGRVTVKSLMTEVSDLQKELSEVRSEMLKLTCYLSATREKLAQLEAKDRPAPSYSDALKVIPSTRSTPGTPASGLLSEEKDRWTVVSSKIKTKPKLMVGSSKINVSPCPTVNNRFRELELEEGELVTDDERFVGLDLVSKPKLKSCDKARKIKETRSVLVIGDSNVRRLDRPMKRFLKDSSKVRVESYSGIGVDRIIDKVSTAVKNENSDKVKVIVHVGTNDVCKTRSQELLDKLGRIVKRAYDARSGVSVDVCTLPSRTDKGSFVYSRSESVNEQLAEVCKINGATCLDLGYCSLGLDGVHYDAKGAHAVSCKIAQKINSFLG